MTDFTISLNNEWKIVSEIQNTAGIIQALKSENNGENWDASELLPRHTVLLKNEYSFMSLVEASAKMGLGSVRELYNEWKISELYKFYYVSLANNWRPKNYKG